VSENTTILYNMKGVQKYKQSLIIWMVAEYLDWIEMFSELSPELKTLEWWISGLRLKPLFFLISSLNIACSPHEFKLQKG